MTTRTLSGDRASAEMWRRYTFSRRDITNRPANYFIEPKILGANLGANLVARISRPNLRLGFSAIQNTSNHEPSCQFSKEGCCRHSHPLDRSQYGFTAPVEVDLDQNFYFIVATFKTLEKLEN